MASIQIRRLILQLSLLGWLGDAAYAQQVPRVPSVRHDPIANEAAFDPRVQSAPSISPELPSAPDLKQKTKLLSSGLPPQTLPVANDEKPIAQATPEERENLARVDNLIQRATNTLPVNAVALSPAELAERRLKDLAEVPLIDAEPAALDGVIPGQTKWEVAVEKFGQPRAEQIKNGSGTATFNFPPFDRAEVTIEKGIVTSILIATGKPLDDQAAAKQLDLHKIRAVKVRETTGELLGMIFPERGVIFAYGADEKGVEQILLEPLSLQSYLWRAEELYQTEPLQAALDIESALLEQPKHPHAHFLKAKLLSRIGHWTDGQTAIKNALTVEPRQPEYRFTLAEIQYQTGKYQAAKQTLEQLARYQNLSAELLARIELLHGDLLATGPQRNYTAAVERHQAAIKLAEPLKESKNPKQRLAAKRVLLDAYLAMANDIAWGNWQQKNVAVNRWLDMAKATAKDLRTKEAAPTEIDFIVARQALAACAGTQGLLDPTPYSKQVLVVAKQIKQESKDRWYQRHIDWELAQSLYDSLQADQARGLNGYTLPNSALVVQYLEDATEHREQTAIDSFMLGRLYYRVGAIFAIDKKDHRTATYWYNKAIPLVSEPLPDATFSDFARHGETLVSMGLSFWETGREEQGVKLTEQGIDWMQRAISGRALNEQALAVPYNNLATMYRTQGKAQQSQEYQALANKLEASHNKRR